MGDLQAIYARFDSAQKSERVTHAMQAKAKKGIYPSLAPVGYLNDPVKRTIIVDQERAPIIRELFEKYADTDISLLELARWAKKRGLGTRKGNAMGKSAIHKVLTNPIYHGGIRWGGVIAQRIHEPIVSKYVFNRVQEKLHGRGHRGSKHVFPFRGLLVCGYCGCQITASLVKGKYVYYHCTKGKGKCPQAYIRQERLSILFSSVVDSVQIPEDVAAMLIEEIRRGEQKRQASLQARLVSLKKEVEGIEHTRSKAYFDKLNGVLEEARWKKLDQQWSKQAQELEEEIGRIEGALHTVAEDGAQEAFELLKRASELYSQQRPAEQARALRILLSNCTLKGERVEPNYRKPFDLVAEGHKTGVWFNRLTDSNYDDTWPCFSPDGTKIVFERRMLEEEKDWAAVFIITVDGNNEQQLTDGSYLDQSPYFSPDGRKIVFQRRGTEELGRAQVMVMKTDGTDLVNLTNNETDQLAPVFSYDGTKIAYHSNMDGEGPDFNICLMNSNGSGKTGLTSSGKDWNPSFAPSK